MGNFVLSYNKTNPPAMKAIKCQYLNCNDVFLEHQHYEQHLIFKHGEMPASLLVKPEPTMGFFSKESLNKHNQYAFKQKIKTYKIMLDLYLKDNKKKSIERQTRQKARKQAQTKDKKPLPKAGINMHSFLASVFDRNKKVEIHE